MYSAPRYRTCFLGDGNGAKENQADSHSVPEKCVSANLHSLLLKNGVFEMYYEICGGNNELRITIIRIMVNER